MGFGDLVCQGLEQQTTEASPSSTTKQWSWNADRSRIMTTTGFFISAPWSHLQHQLLERFVPGTVGSAVAKKVALSVATAPIAICLMFTSVLVLQGESEKVVDKLSKDVLPMWLVGSTFMPIVLGVNFRYVPVRHRPLVAALYGSVWSVYSAYMANKKEEEEEPVLLAVRRFTQAASIK